MVMCVDEILNLSVCDSDDQNTRKILFPRVCGKKHAPSINSEAFLWTESNVGQHAGDFT
jgi:hypothetical protein